VTRLIVQEIRRNIFGLWFGVWFGYVLWSHMADGTVSTSWAVTLSLVVTVVARTSFMHQPKELLVLPVSRHQLRHARWLFATIIPAALVATGQAITMILPWIHGASTLHIETVTLSSVCDLAYLGVGYAVFLTTSRITAAADRLIIGGGIVVAVFLPLGSVCWGLLLHPYMPTQWADLAGVRGVVLAAGLGLMAWTYAHAPADPRMFRPVAEGVRHPRGASFAGRIIVRFLGVRPKASPAPPERVWLPTSRLGSVLSVVLPQCATTSLLVGGLLLALGDPFAKNGAGAFTACWMGAAVVISWPSWNGRLRQLRTLPLTAWQVNALQLGTTTVLWLSVCTTVTLLHLLFPARLAASFRPEIVLGLIGVSVLSDAASLQPRWTKGLMAVLGVLLVAGTVRYVAGAPPAVAWQASALFGVIALVAAALLNQRALTRSSAVYQR